MNQDEDELIQSRKSLLVLEERKEVLRDKMVEMEHRIKKDTASLLKHAGVTFHSALIMNL
jgi:hypothetical protein